MPSLFPPPPNKRQLDGPDLLLGGGGEGGGERGIVPLKFIPFHDLATSLQPIPISFDDTDYNEFQIT